jgi:hypothetical protein
MCDLTLTNPIAAGGRLTICQRLAVGFRFVGRDRPPNIGRRIFRVHRNSKALIMKSPDDFAERLPPFIHARVFFSAIIEGSYTGFSRARLV